MHVDAESCTYWRGSLQVDAHRWASIIQNENTPGTLIDIKVLLPDEGTRWEVSVRRTIQHGFQDTSGLPSEKVKLGDDIREESLRAFDVLYPVNGSGVSMPLFCSLAHFDDQSRGRRSILVARFLHLCWTESSITLKHDECSKATIVRLGEDGLHTGLDVVFRIIVIPKTRKVGHLLQNMIVIFRLPTRPYENTLDRVLGPDVLGNSTNSNVWDTQNPGKTCIGFPSRQQKYLLQWQRMTSLKVSIYIWTTHVLYRCIPWPARQTPR